MYHIAHYASVHVHKCDKILLFEVITNLVNDMIASNYNCQFTDIIKKKDDAKNNAIDILSSYLNNKCSIYFSKYLWIIILNYLQEEITYDLTNDEQNLKSFIPMGQNFCEINYGIHTIYTKCNRYNKHKNCEHKYCLKPLFRMIYKKNGNIDVVNQKYLESSYENGYFLHKYQYRIAFDIDPEIFTNVNVNNIIYTKQMTSIRWTNKFIYASNKEHIK